MSYDFLQPHILNVLRVNPLRWDCSCVYIYMKDPSDRIVFVLPSRCSLLVARFTERGYVYIRVLWPLVATRHFSPAPRRSACGRPRNKERKNKVRLHSIDSARSSVSSLLEREKEEATSIKGFSCLVCHDRSVIYTWRVTSRSIFAPVTLQF